MPMLFVRCHKCATSFPSGIAPTEENLGGLLLAQVLEKCPNCSDLGTYNTADFFFPAGEPAPVAEATVEPTSEPAPDTSAESPTPAWPGGLRPRASDAGDPATP